MLAHSERLKQSRCSIPVILIFCTPLPAVSQTHEAFPDAAPESQGLSSSALKELSDVVRAFVDEGKIVGAELLVIKNRKTVLHEAVGWKDREDQVPMETNTIFNIRSMTKPVTGTAAQMLIDDGKLSLSDPVAKYLPSFDNDKSRDITVEHLLTHRSGLGWTSCMVQDSLRAIADCCGQRGPEEFIPGTSFRYSNGGSSTIGAVVEEITGKPLDQFMRDRVFRPLGMGSTFGLHRGSSRQMPRCASRYMLKDATWTRYWNPSDGPQFKFMRGAQGLGSTPADYARFLAMWMDRGLVGGQRLLSESAVQRGTSPVSLADVATGFPKTSVYYGQQWMLYIDSTGERPAAWGHAGSDGTHAWAWPDLDLMVLYFTQSSNNTTGLLLEREIDRLVISPDRVADDIPDQFAPYVGLYWSKKERMYSAIIIMDGELTLELPGKFLFKLRATDDPDSWKPVDRPDIQIRFKRDKAGSVVALIPPAFAKDGPNERLQIDEGLPSPSELMALRKKGHGTAGLSQLGIFRLDGTMKLGVGMEGIDTLFSDGHLRSREEINIPNIQEGAMICNGDRAWTVSPTAGSTQMTGIEREQAILARLAVVIGDWSEFYKELRVLKRTRICGCSADVFIVRAVPIEAPAVTYLVNAETGITMKSLFLSKLPLGFVGQSVTYEDYREVEGVKMPFRWKGEYAIPSLGQMTLQYDKVTTRLEAADDAFRVRDGTEVP